MRAYRFRLTHSSTFSFSQPSSVFTQESPGERQSLEMNGILSRRFSGAPFTNDLYLWKTALFSLRTTRVPANLTGQISLATDTEKWKRIQLARSSWTGASNGSGKFSSPPALSHYRAKCLPRRHKPRALFRGVANPTRMTLNVFFFLFATPMYPPASRPRKQGKHSTQTQTHRHCC